MRGGVAVGLALVVLCEGVHIGGWNLQGAYDPRVGNKSVSWVAGGFAWDSELQVEVLGRYSEIILPSLPARQYWATLWVRPGEVLGEVWKQTTAGSSGSFAVLVNTTHVMLGEGGELLQLDPRPDGWFELGMERVLGKYNVYYNGWKVGSAPFNDEAGALLSAGNRASQHAFTNLDFYDTRPFCGKGERLYKGGCVFEGSCAMPFTIHTPFDLAFAKTFALPVGLGLASGTSGWVWDDGSPDDYKALWKAKEPSKGGYAVLEDHGAVAESSQFPVVLCMDLAVPPPPPSPTSHPTATPTLIAPTPPPPSPVPAATPTLTADTLTTHTLTPAQLATNTVSPPVAHATQSLTLPSRHREPHPTATVGSSPSPSAVGSRPSATATGVPQPTPAPGRSVPEKPKEATKQALGVAAALGGATASGGAVAKLALLTGINCEVEDIDLKEAEPIDWEYHPTGIPIGTHRHRYFLGAVVFNSLIVATFVGLAVCIAYLQTKTCSVPWPVALGYMRAPGLVYIPLLFLMQGTSLAASNMALFPFEKRWVAVVGWVYFVLCVGVPASLWWFLLRGARFQATTVPDPRLDERANAVVAQYHKKEEQLTGTRRWLYKLLYGEELWVRRDGAADHYVEQYGLFFEMTRGGMQWFVAVELLQMIFISSVSVIRPKSMETCTARNSVISAVLLLYLVLLVWFHPYNSKLDNVVAVLMAGTMFVAVLLMTVALELQGPRPAASVRLTDIAGWMLLGGAYLLFVKGVYDIVLYLLDIKMGRRKRAQEAARAGCVANWAAGTAVTPNGSLQGLHTLNAFDHIPLYSPRDDEFNHSLTVPTTQCDPSSSISESLVSNPLGRSWSYYKRRGDPQSIIVKCTPLLERPTPSASSNDFQRTSSWLFTRGHI